MSANSVKWVRLGDYIEEYSEKNINNHIKDVRSVSVFKEFRLTGAKVDKNELRGYKIVPPKCIAYVQTTKNEKCFAQAVNMGDTSVVVSSVDRVIKSKDENILNIEYLHLFFLRGEFDRYAIFNSWGSAREVFSFDDLCNVNIPLPSIETQRQLVSVYNGLKSIAEENESLLKPLSEACQAFVIDCIKKYPCVSLGDYIVEYDEKNAGNIIKDVRSVSVYKDFRPTSAKVNKAELSGYKIVPPNHIAYVQTTKNEKCFAHALNSTNQSFVVTAVDRVIKSKDDNLLDITFLSLFLRRKEFDRYAIFNSWGSAREVFSFEDLCAVQIPLPPKDIQQSIVNLYRCYEEARQIAAQARDQLKTICPALIQKAAHSAQNL